MDYPDPHLQGMLGVPRVERVAEVVDLTGVLGIDADENLHERGLARAVLPDKGMDLPFVEVEIHMAKRMHTREALVDFPHRKDLAAHSMDS